MLNLKFLIVASVYMILAVIGIGGLIGLAAMAFTYKLVFGAGWVEALVIGILGGIFGWIAIITVLASFIEAVQ